MKYLWNLWLDLKGYPKVAGSSYVLRTHQRKNRQLTHSQLTQRCELCGIKNAGACIQCTKPSCFAAFHTTCARKEKLLMPMKSAHGAEPASLTAFCDRHLPVSLLIPVTCPEFKCPYSSQNNNRSVLLHLRPKKAVTAIV